MRLTLSALLSRPALYTMDGDGRIQPEHDHEAWATWRESAEQNVCTSRILDQFHRPIHTVSTVFLGVDHQLGSRLLGPRLFESIVTDVDGVIAYIYRNYTRSGAQDVHERLLKIMRVIHGLDQS